MLNSKTNNDDEIELVMKKYLDSLPEKTHTSVEQENLLNRVAERVNINYSEQKEKHDKNLFESISVKFKKLLAIPPEGNRKPYFQPALLLAMVLILLFTAGIYYLNFKKDNINATGKIDNKVLSSQNNDQQSPPVSITKDKDELKIEFNEKTEISQIDVIQFRITQRALIESKDSKFEPDSVLMLKLFNITSDVVNKKGIKTHPFVKNKLVTDWFITGMGIII